MQGDPYLTRKDGKGVLGRRGRGSGGSVMNVQRQTHPQVPIPTPSPFPTMDPKTTTKHTQMQMPYTAAAGRRPKKPLPIEDSLEEGSEEVEPPTESEGSDCEGSQAGAVPDGVAEAAEARRREALLKAPTRVIEGVVFGSDNMISMVGPFGKDVNPLVAGLKRVLAHEVA